MRTRVAGFLCSWWLPAIRILTSAVALIVILGGFDMIDISTIALPEEFFAITLAATIIMGLLAAVTLEQRNYHQALDNKGLDASEMPKDRRYQVGTLFAVVLGVATGLYLGPAVIVAHVIGAGLWTYVLVCGLIAAGASVCWEIIIHCGLREFLVRARDYVSEIVPEIRETGETIIGAVGTLKTEGAPEDSETPALQREE